MSSYSEPTDTKRKRLKKIIIIEIVIILVCIGLDVERKLREKIDQDVVTASTELTTTESTTEITTEEPTTEDPQVVYEREVSEQAQQILDSMSTEEKLYQLFIVTPEQLTNAPVATQAGEATQTALTEQPVGGVIYFAENIVTREQCEEMIANTKSYSRYGLFIAVDEEGGRVARVGSNPAMETTSFSSMSNIGASEDTAQAYDVGYTLGTELAELGFNLDFAPVADVNSNPNNTVIGDRSFSSDPTIAADMAAACVQGFEDSGMLSCIKHFPGHGDTAADSHYGAASSNKTIEELRECEFLPFEAGMDAGVPIVMVGHISLPNATEDSLPGTLSKEIVTGMLRDELGYDGLVVTDSMRMQAITDRYSSGTASVMAVQAGVDCILMPADLSDAVRGLQEALDAGEITEEEIDEHVMRILKTKIRYGIIENNEGNTEAEAE